MACFGTMGCVFRCFLKPFYRRLLAGGCWEANLWWVWCLAVQFLEGSKWMRNSYDMTVSHSLYSTPRGHFVDILDWGSYICIYIYIDIYIYIYIYIYMYIYIIERSTGTYTYIDVYVYEYIYICVCVWGSLLLRHFLSLLIGPCCFRPHRSSLWRQWATFSAI